MGAVEYRTVGFLPGGIAAPLTVVWPLVWIGRRDMLPFAAGCRAPLFEPYRLEAFAVSATGRAGPRMAHPCNDVVRAGRQAARTPGNRVRNWGNSAAGSSPASVSSRQKVTKPISGLSQAPTTWHSTKGDNVARLDGLRHIRIIERGIRGFRGISFCSPRGSVYRKCKVNG